MKENRKDTLVTPRIIGTRVTLLPNDTVPGQAVAEVSYLLGNDVVTIRSNIRGLPPTDLKGKEAVTHVRDALTRVLKTMI